MVDLLVCFRSVGRVSAAWHSLRLPSRAGSDGAAGRFSHFPPDLNFVSLETLLALPFEKIIPFMNQLAEVPAGLVSTWVLVTCVNKTRGAGKGSQHQDHAAGGGGHDGGAGAVRSAATPHPAAANRHQEVWHLRQQQPQQRQS